MRKFLTKVVAITLMIFGATVALVPCTVYAKYDPCVGLSEEAKKANNCPGTDEYTDSDVGSAVVSIGNAIIGIASVVAVVVIVIGGARYMTAAGDAGKMKKAKDTILGAAIGLVICALAAVLVNFVVKTIVRADTAGNYTTQGSCEAKGYYWTGTKCE